MLEGVLKGLCEPLLTLSIEVSILGMLEGVLKGPTPFRLCGMGSVSILGMLEGVLKDSGSGGSAHI